MNHIIVIGGGASGMMAAIAAARKGAKVTILEQKDSLGKKLLATGNGHCNYTNEKMDVSCFHGNDWAMEQIASYGVQETLAFFEELGIFPLSKQGYVYPASEQASSMLMALETELKRLKVRIITEAQVKCITPAGGNGYDVDVIITTRKDASDLDKGAKGKKNQQKGKKTGKPSVETKRCSLSCQKVILATGGKAASKLGSDGSGYYLSGLLGHGLVEPLPALTGIQCKETWFEKVAGVRIQGTVSLWEKQGKELVLLDMDTGEIQLTNYGISGIPVFQISQAAARALAGKKALKVSMKFHPGITDEAYEAYLKNHSPKVFGGMFPDKLLDVLFQIPGALEERTIWCSPVEMNDFEKAQVTTGGIPVGEIHKGTMESKLCPGLYLVGEVVDVDGICGGYNLQWAWTSGYLAGKHAGRKGIV